MAKKTKSNKYAIENLPLSEKTRDGIRSGVLIDILSAMGDMMNLQDDSYEETYAEILDTLKSLQEGQEDGFGKIHKRLTSIELRLDSIEHDQKQLHKKDDALEGQIKTLEGKLKEFQLQLEDLKTEFEAHKNA